MERTIEKGISDLVGVFTDPIVVFPGGWEDTLPEWLKHAIINERLIENVRAIKDGEMTGTDAEACAYLYTAVLTQPIDYDWTQIYLHIVCKVYEIHRSKESGMSIPEDIKVESLNNHQLRDLRQLKDFIYQQRCKIRLERDRAERRQKKEEEAARRKEEQPTLFDFE